MSSNQNGGGNNNNNSDTKVAVVALVVSVVALVGTLLQVGQQYLASAAGYSSCDESVIGPWHKTKRRQFRYSEMRFRVLFKSPVFFVCAADNKRGPVAGAKVYFVNGTDISINKTLSLPVADPEVPPPPPGENGTANPDSTPNAVTTGLRKVTEKLGGGARRRNWFGHRRDTGHSEPVSERKNTEIQDQEDNDSDAASPAPALSGDQKGVHTVDSEMATWVHLLHQLHCMEKYSLAWEKKQLETRLEKEQTVEKMFKAHTLCVAVQSKELSWDTMPASINRPYATTTISHMLEMAAMLGIYWKQFDEATRNYRAEGNGYVLTGSRIADFGGIFFNFQVSGKNIFAENRIIPADECKELAFGLVPTIFRQTEDIRRLKFKVDDIHNLGTLLLCSPRQFGETLASIGCNTYSSNCLQNDGARYGHLFPLSFEVMGMVGKKLHRKGSSFRFLPNPSYNHWDKKYFSMNLLLEAYHLEIEKVTVLDKSDKSDNQLRTVQETRLAWLRTAAQEVNNIIPKKTDQNGVDYALMDLLDHNITVCDDFLRAKGRDRVGLVLRQHIQQVLYMVNGEDGSKPGRSDTPTKNLYDELMAATPADRQKLLMEIYFSKLRGAVTEKAEAAFKQSGSANDQAASTSNDTKSWAFAHEDKNKVETDFVQPCKLLEAEAVWCTLVFRMLCWLTLHDFNKADVQFEKHELLGSRLPVFIR